MKKVISLDAIPNKSIISGGFKRIDYLDSYMIEKETTYTIDKLTTEVFRTPKWVNWLMKLRNSIVKLFGLKTDETIQESDYYPIGARAMGFPVINRNDNEILMEEDDKHLIFRVSVLNDRKESKIYVTTIVHYNNIGGKIYFFPVKFFHSIIVKSQLRRILKMKE